MNSSRLSGKLCKSYYPEILERKDHIMNIIKVEEERFIETFNDGLERLNEDDRTGETIKPSVIPGEEVFRLYDTYGFPKELTEEYVRGIRIFD